MPMSFMNLNQNRVRWSLWLACLLLACQQPEVSPKESEGDFPRADTLSESLVFGGYFAWHGTPSVDGQWSRWNDEGRQPDQQDIASMYWPQKGPYSSGDPEVLRQQAAEMKQAGIDVVMLFWNNAYPGEQARLEQAMRVFGQEGLQGLVAVDFDWSLPRPQQLTDMAQRLHTVVHTYAHGDDPELRAFYYRDPASQLPLFLLYGPLRFAGASYWDERIERYKEEPGGIFMAGKVGDVQELANSRFDGISWTGHAASSDQDQEGHEHHLRALKRKMFYVGGVIVGFDERHRPKPSPTVLARRGGATFLEKWHSVQQAQTEQGDQVDHVYVPFNDWGEGIGIEPVAAQPVLRGGGFADPFDRLPPHYLTNDPLAGDAYLGLTREQAQAFRESRKP